MCFCLSVLSALAYSLVYMDYNNITPHTMKHITQNWAGKQVNDF